MNDNLTIILYINKVKILIITYTQKNCIFIRYRSPPFKKRGTPKPPKIYCPTPLTYRRSQRSADRAAMVPSLIAVVIWRNGLSTISPAANTPGILVDMSGAAAMYPCSVSVTTSRNHSLLGV